MDYDSVQFMYGFWMLKCADCLRVLTSRVFRSLPDHIHSPPIKNKLWLVRSCVDHWEQSISSLHLIKLEHVTVHIHYEFRTQHNQLNQVHALQLSQFGTVGDNTQFVGFVS